MNWKTIALSSVAGILGGMISDFIRTQPAQAQAQMPATREIRTQSLVIVNDRGEIQGTFLSGLPSNGQSRITLLDGTGREIWSAGGPQIRPLNGH